jgi:hypothetical protein
MRARGQINIRWIRRDSKRDVWIAAVTKEFMGTGIPAAPRVLRFKEAVASEYGAARSLWFTAERDPSIPDDVDWHFGFALARDADDGRTETPVPGPERRPPPPPQDPADGPVASSEDLANESVFMDEARRMRKAEDKADLVIRNAIEAWSLADTEAWRFTRAYLARSMVERLKWEAEEAKYAGGAGSEKGRKSGWGWWLDRSEQEG